MRVRPDVVGIEKTFDYLVPDDLRDQVRVGTEVRIALGRRRVGGWVVEADVVPAAGVNLRPIAKRRGWGPSAEVVDLASWAAWRWAGRIPTLLRTASPPAAVRALPSASTREITAKSTVDPETTGMADDALAHPVSVVRLPPAVDPLALVEVIARRALASAGRPNDGAGDAGSVLVLCPEVGPARHIGLRLRRLGLPVAIVADEHPGTAAAGEWARAAAGRCVVVGARAGAWAPTPGLAAAIVLDEHDETYQEERAPTWHARDVVIERASRARARCILVSSCPTLEALGVGHLVTPSRATERDGWSVIDVVDRRREDTTARSLLSPRLATALRDGARVVCVLNRTGRSRLSACVVCGELARCEVCGAVVVQTSEGALRCGRCGTERPAVCLACGSHRFKVLRPGVSRLRDEIEALVGERVVEVTGAAARASEQGPVTARVVVGTEAVLHRVEWADVVAFCDFDQELTAPRYRAAEEALVLLARASRVVGGRHGHGHGAQPGRVLVQTRLPDHVVLRAALQADPSLVATAEVPLRRAMRFPPAAALALVAGAGAAAFLEAFGSPIGVEVLGPNDGAWLLRADDHRTLCDALAATPRPAERVRIAVDPVRV